MNEQHGAGEDAGCYLASSSFLHFSYVFNIFFFLMFWKRDALITYDRETLTQHSIHYLGPHQQTGMEACLGYVIGKEPDS